MYCMYETHLYKTQHVLASGSDRVFSICIDTLYAAICDCLYDNMCAKLHDYLFYAIA